MLKSVCASHFEDNHIKYFIKKNGKHVKCSYCNRTKVKTIELGELARFIEKGFKLLYDYAVEWLPYESAEGGYQGDTFETYELLSTHVELLSFNDDLFWDLSWEISDDVWCHNDPYGETESEMLLFDWKAFKDFVMHRSRYTFFFLKRDSYRNYKVKVSKILEEIGSILYRYKLIQTLSAGVIMYRCRQHDKKTVIIEAKDICSPPDEYAIFPNRMSPAGISMFYGAFDESTAIAETVDKHDRRRNYMSLANLKTTRDLLVVNLQNLPLIPSIFDQRRNKNYFSLSFLRSFVEDLSQPINKDGKEHIDYVPTQIITEYIRFMFSRKHKKQIDGIIYPSAKSTAKPCCVLFLNHEESIDTFIVDRIRKEKVSSFIF